jgi:O-antigen/teichoic acid export membrane protein
MLKRISGSAWSVLEYGWYPLLLLVTTPWFLHRLGADNYGYWMLLTAIVGLGGVLNTGTGAATIKAVSSRLGEGKGIESQVRASLGIAMIGGGALATLVLLMFQLGGGSLLGKMGDNSRLIQMTGVVAAILLWLEQIDIVASSALKGAERFAQAAQLEILGKTVQMGVSMAATWHLATMDALYAALLLGAFARLALKLVSAKSILGLKTLLPSTQRMGETLKFARWGWLQGIGGVLFGVADRILIGSILGAASLTYYSIATQLAMQIHAVCAAALSVIFPIVSRKLGAGDNQSILRLARSSIVINIVLASILSLTLLITNDWILNLWLGQEQSRPVAQALLYLLPAYWLMAINVAAHYLLLSMGKIRFLAISNLVAGTLMATAAAIMMHHYGLLGAALSRTLYGVIILVNFIPLAGLVRKEKI